MFKLGQREKYLLVGLIATLLLSLLYTKILEPYLKSLNTYGQREIDKSDQELLKRKEQIESKNKLIFDQEYWKSDLGKQQIELQRMVESIAREARIETIKNIYVLNSIDQKDYTEIGLQMSFEANINTLTRFLYKLETAHFPIMLDKLSLYEENNKNLIRVEVQLRSIYLNI